jgi:predicted glycosyltransferase
LKILVDIGHPAHVHLFKNFAFEMMNKGHVIIFSVREKEHEKDLLDIYDLPYKSLGKHRKSKMGKILGFLIFGIRILILSLRYKPDIYLSHGSIYVSPISWLLGKPHIALEDTGNNEQVRLYMPFTRTVLTSDVFPQDYGGKQIRYRSHHELAYLHPDYFIPDPDFKQKIGSGNEEKYVLLRFVSWEATHDQDQKGLSAETKRILVNELLKNYRVIISAESGLPSEYQAYAASFHPRDIHDALYHAELFIGEGTTMAMEAAILGTPSVYINSLQYENVKDMEKYGLLFRFNNDLNLMDKISGIISRPDLKKDLKCYREKMISEKINLTAFLIWFVEDYPQSVVKMTDQPEYQNRFC